jgi:hypothetical protein
MMKQTSALDAGISNRPTLVHTPESSERGRWKEVATAASIRISELLEMIRQIWGADHFPVIIIQPATIAAFALFEDLEQRRDSQEAFYKLCIILRAASRRFRVNRGVLRLIEKTAKEKRISLPDGCDQLLADFNTAMDLDGSVSATTEDIGLDYLLEKWDDLDLNDGY